MKTNKLFQECLSHISPDIKQEVDIYLDRLVSEAEYKASINRMEKLLPEVTDELSADNPLCVELQNVSNIIITYEWEHFPMGDNEIEK